MEEYFTLRTNDFTRRKCATLDAMHRILTANPHTFGKFEWEKETRDFIGGFTCKAVMRVPLSLTPSLFSAGGSYGSGRELLFCGFEATWRFLPFVYMPQLYWLGRITS